MSNSNKLDLKAVQAKTQSGRDPVIEKKAMDYSKRDWQMTIEPLFAQLASNEELHPSIATAFKSDAFLALVQKAMVDHKYDVLEKADDNKIELAKTDLLFVRKI